jgi:hypothetical protein
MGIWSVISGIAIGVAGTAVAWVLKTHLLKPRMRMSEQISKMPEQGTATWRIKLGNYSWQPALDLSIHAVLRATGVTTVMAVGLSSDSIDILPRCALGKPGRRRLVYLDPANLTAFAVRRLPETLQAKIQNPELHGPIELDDLLSLGQADRPATLTVTAFCFNGLSGTRKHFARRYTLSDIQGRPFRAGSLQPARPKARATPDKSSEKAR